MKNKNNIPIRMAQIKKKHNTTISSANKDMEQLELSYIPGGYTNDRVQPPWKTVW